jgi:hypothetical protein
MPPANNPNSQSGPSAPNIKLSDIGQQVYTDVYGKEVQSANTYSYTWMADQAGHLFLGILLNFIFTLLLVHWPFAWPEFSTRTAQLLGILLAACLTSYWEFKAYWSSVRTATNKFALGKPLLAANAGIAAGYMAMGAIMAFGFWQDAPLNIGIVLAMALLAVLCAPWWIRQKIIWQKAGLPYLFRLAYAPPGFEVQNAEALQSFIDAGVPPGGRPQQVVVAGPMGSGRTAIAAGIGTEFAFKNASVRYLGLDNLLEFAAEPPGSQLADSPGPVNIGYWPWRQAQIVIIDDIGPFIGIQAQDKDQALEQFKKILDGLRAAAPALRRSHTVWVVGDLDHQGPSVTGQLLQDIARAIRDFCGGQDYLLIELFDPQEQPAGGPRLELTAKRASIRRIGL